MHIISARITAMPKDMFGPMPQVYVTMDNGKEEFLFEYYPDEISFSADEFVGKTKKECFTLKFEKDRRYLTS